ncbi:MAG: polysaccharide pyruvyl transferase family protein [Deltaproteobacteria bacterium]|nr:polysaccharide pyruvyl transferase family protein [Candidatus Anaeroferrophillacea bacterium]
MKPIRLYWSSSLKDGRKNFGDWLSPVLCEALSGRPVVHAKPERCDLIACGSILQRLKNRPWTRRILVWGTGFIDDRLPAKTRHHILATRGRLTAAKLTNAAVTVFGDPGLLCERLVQKPGVRAGIGIVPHYYDRRHPLVARLEGTLPGCRVIDILGGVDEVLREIARCQVVLSSSLHGLIVADALGIPNAWIELSDRVRGAGFKFRDYYSVFGLADAVRPFPLTADTGAAEIFAIRELWSRPGIDDIKQRLAAAFPY